tara:strand:- start:317 stop:769 length:453 start_codon:yes stop_codon:yes gene_type:complete
MKIKQIFYDFDGVMTNNQVLLSEDGTESVFVNRSDGLAVSYFKKIGIEQCIISTETNLVVSKRAEKLKIPCYQGISNKLEEIKKLLTNSDLHMDDVAYVGNDLNDLEVMQYLPNTFCPKDSHPEILKVAQHTLKSSGGEGVIMDLYNTLT